MSDLYKIRGSTMYELATLVKLLSDGGTERMYSPDELIEKLSECNSGMMTAYEVLSQKGADLSGNSLTIPNLPGFIDTLNGGGGSGSAAVPAKDVNFFDYDGTLLHSYTIAEAQALTSLPNGPTHDGLVFQRWNWSLEDVTALTQKMNIGALYTTDDGTTRIYIHLEEGRTSPMLGVCPNGTVTVDWGDGTAPNTVTGTSTGAVKWTPTHNYAKPGDYVIRLTVNGSMGFAGASGTDLYAYILRHSSSGDTRNYAYRNAVRKIETGSGVTFIGEYAFQYCQSLSSITIPDSVTSIGKNAFYYCQSLSSITIPDGVTSIGKNAFYYCQSLSSITIPDSVTSIGEYAFQYCQSLSSITIPDSVTSIGEYAFQYCQLLSSITIPDSVTSIGKNAFYYCQSLSSITIPDGVTFIGEYAFYYCQLLSSITIPDSVTSIGANALYNCYSLSSITIPDSVTSIGANAFYYCYSVRFYDFLSHTSVPTLSNTRAFLGITADCEIRVPAALYDEWVAATNWSAYASKIVAV